MRLPPRPARPASVTRPVVQFSAAGLAAMAVLGFVGAVVLRHLSTSQALDRARQVTSIAGRGIVEPALTDGLLSGEPAAIARVDAVVRRSVLRDPVVRVKIWTGQGRILYSDEPRLIGNTFPLRDDEREVLKKGGVAAEVTDLSRPENSFERSYRKLLEVYLPVRTAGGRPLLFEEYQRFTAVTERGQRLWVAFIPVLLGALVVLYLVQVPLAWSMARRIREGQRQREELLRRAIEASEIERRRIAADLHDGVVQDLAAVSYSLAAAAESAGDGDVSGALREAAAGTGQCIRQLRTLLLEIYPPSLRTAGLEAALSDLVTPLQGRGLDAKVTVRGTLDLPAPTESLLFRAAQEAVRNVVRHARATRVRVEVGRTDGSVALLVEDDGRGFDVNAPPVREGHLGLRLVAELAADAGGRLDLDSAPGRGTRVRLEVPVS